MAPGSDVDRFACAFETNATVGPIGDNDRPPVGVGDLLADCQPELGPRRRGRQVGYHGVQHNRATWELTPSVSNQATLHLGPPL